MRLRLSWFTYVILALCVVMFTCAVLALCLPWGTDKYGLDIRSGLEGILPWFLFIPFFLQLGFLVIETELFQVLFIVANFVTGVFVLLFHLLSWLKYSTSFQPGFYLVFIGAGIALISGILCVLERRLFTRLAKAGRARVVGIGHHLA